MTATFHSSFLLHVGILYLLARLATSTIMNPSIEPVPVCLPTTTPNKPTAVDCTAAMLALPRSQQGVDYHIEPITSGRPRSDIYDTILTSVGPTSEPYYLPRISYFDSCRVTVRMAEGIHFARVLWLNVQQAILAVIHSCVNEMAVSSAAAGPGAGGSTSIGHVMISVEYVELATGPGKPKGGDLIRTGRVAGSAPPSGSRIGLNIPPAVGTT